MMNQATIAPSASTPKAIRRGRWYLWYQGGPASGPAVTSWVLGSTVVAIFPTVNVASARSAPPDHAPGVTRTRGQQFRKLLLYPSELRGPEILLAELFAEPP